MATAYPLRVIGRRSAGWTIALGVLLILLGLFALIAPLVAGVAITFLFAWLLLLGGIAHLVLAWHGRGVGSHLWETFIGLAYIVLGSYLFYRPLIGLVALTAFLGAYLFVKGVLQLILWFRVRGIPGGGWLLFDAVVSLLLSGIIWLHLPYSATWVIGTLLGFAILFSGISRVVIGMHARRVVLPL